MSRVHRYVDSTDMAAFKRDLDGIYRRFGYTESRCPPRLRAERARQIHSANETLRQCMYEPHDG